MPFDGDKSGSSYNNNNISHVSATHQTWYYYYLCARRVALYSYGDPNSIISLRFYSSIGTQLSRAKLYMLLCYFGIIYLTRTRQFRLPLVI